MVVFTIYPAVLLTFVSVTLSAVVKWLPNSSFNIPSNFKDGKLPCSKKTVVFPQSMSGSVGLESLMDVSALILPDDGELVLENAVITLGEDMLNPEKNCSNGNSYYLDKSTSAWNQAGVWSSLRFNEATPDTERVPCYNDVVEFPINTKYTVCLPNEEQVIRALVMGNDSYTTQSFTDYINGQTDQMEQFVFNDYLQTGVTVNGDSSCQETAGCPCQKHPVTIDCTVKFCPKPQCVTPIKPTGYCCSFCGGYIMFDVDEGFDLISFKELVNKIVDGYGNTVAYHIGLTSVTPDRTIQLVIVDKGEYSGNSAEAVFNINNEIFSHWYKGEKLSQISGSPLSEQGFAIKLFVSMFFAVIIVLGAIYLYYYRLPAVTFPAGLRFGIRPRGLFRYENRSDSVVSLTRRDSSVMPMPRTAFRNPLYDSRRGRVQVEETSVEES